MVLLFVDSQSISFQWNLKINLVEERKLLKHYVSNKASDNSLTNVHKHVLSFNRAELPIQLCAKNQNVFRKFQVII